MVGAFDPLQHQRLLASIRTTRLKAIDHENDVHVLGIQILGGEKVSISFDRDSLLVLADK